MLKRISMHEEARWDGNRYRRVALSYRYDWFVYSWLLYMRHQQWGAWKLLLLRCALVCLFVLTNDTLLPIFHLFGTSFTCPVDSFYLSSITAVIWYFLATRHASWWSLWRFESIAAPSASRRKSSSGVSIFLSVCSRGWGDWFTPTWWWGVWSSSGRSCTTPLMSSSPCWSARGETSVHFLCFLLQRRYYRGRGWG